MMSKLINLILFVIFVCSQALDEDTEENLKLAQYRLRHRRTIDGKLCAAAFVHNKQRFTDCTDTIAPDGITFGKEWCYVEAQYKIEDKPPEWNFCREYVDYESLRELTSRNLKVFLAQSSDLVKKLSDDEAKLKNLVDQFEKICINKLTTVKNQLSNLEVLLTHIDHSIVNSDKAKNSILLYENTVEEVRSNYDSQAISSIKDKNNCSGLRGYDEDSIADGLLATYYQSLEFLVKEGTKITQIDPLISFIWRDRDPVKGISLYEFSARWDGFLLPPLSGEYIFSLESSCGARLFINKKLVLVDRMSDTPYIAVEKLGLEGVKVIFPNEPSGIKKTMSPKIYLTGNERVPIRIEMIHSSRLMWTNENNAMIKLYWSSDFIDETIISSEYFYTKKKFPDLRLSGLPTSFCQVDYTLRGMEPFLGDNSKFIGDLPSTLEGSKIIKMSLGIQSAMNSEEINDHFNTIPLESNIPANIIIAHRDHLSVEVENGYNLNFKKYDNDFLTIFTAKSRNERATHVDKYNLSYAIVSPNVLYKLKISPYPYIIFVKGLGGSTDNCTGETVLLSDPKAKNTLFSSCSVSNKQSDKYDCEYALNSQITDAPYSTWKTSLTGLGQYLELTLRKKARITAFKFQPLSDPLEWPSELTLNFFPDESDKQVYSLIYSSDTSLLTYQISPIVTDYVKVQISRMYASNQKSGGSIFFYGVECGEEEKHDANNDLKIINIPAIKVDSCAASLTNIDNLPSLSYATVLDIYCTSYCGKEEIANIDIWGTNIYSYESPVCVSAIHAGICKLGEHCSMNLRVLSGNRFHVGSKKNGIISYNHGHSHLSYTIQPLPLHTPPNNVNNKLDTSQLDKAERINIIFSAKNLDFPKNILHDAGKVITQTAMMSYGWKRQPQVVLCDNLMNETKFSDSIQLEIMKSGFSFNPSPKSKICKQSQIDCSQNSWTIYLAPRSLYSVTIQLGNGCNPEKDEYIYNLSINNIEVVKNIALRASEFYYATAINIPTSQDGKLEFTSECTEDNCDNALTTIQQMKITKENYQD